MIGNPGPGGEKRSEFDIGAERVIYNRLNKQKVAVKTPRERSIAIIIIYYSLTLLFQNYLFILYFNL